MRERARVRNTPVAETNRLPESDPLDNPAIGRLLYLDTYSRGFGVRQIPEDTIQTVASHTEQDVDFSPLKELSLLSIAAYYEKLGQEGTQRHGVPIEHNQMAIRSWLVTGNLQSEADERAKRDHVLGIIGIDPQNLSPEERDKRPVMKFTENGIEEERRIVTFKGLRKFWEKYFKDGADVQKFITDIANDCRTVADGSVDVLLLTRRLQAIEPLLHLFGDKYEVPTLIKFYGQLYGLLSQKDPDKKQAIARKAAHAVTQKMTGETDIKAISAIIGYTKNAKTLMDEEKSEVWKKITRKVNETVEQAREENFTTTQADAMHGKEDFAVFQYLHTPERSWQELQQELISIKKKEFATITFATAREFDMALRHLGISSGDREDLVRHERAHFAEAARQGCDGIMYQIQIAIDPDTKHPVVYPATIYRFPRSLTESERKRKYILVLEAPEKAGGSMSPGDLRQRDGPEVSLVEKSAA